MSLGKLQSPLPRLLRMMRLLWFVVMSLVSTSQPVLLIG